MKKLFSLFIMCLLGTMSLFAQTNPNRVLITDKSGNTKSYLAERVDSIWFAQVEGRIAADIEYLGYVEGGGENEEDVIQVKITRTPGCEAFKIDCLPKNRADMLGSETAIASYLDQSGLELYWQDFTAANMSGYEFQSGVEYSIITLGYDMYGTPCGANRVDFTAPKKPLVGDCSIDYEILTATKDAITIHFTPASGVAGYAALQFPAGTAEENFEMVGSMFGFNSMGDYIKGMGFNGVGEQTFTWERNDPCTEYEVYVQAWDVNGTYADMLIVPVKTENVGGEGVAEMTIEIGEFGISNDAYYQVVTYTPNDQVAMHRDMLIENNTPDAEDEEYILNYLKADNPMDPNWNQFGVDVAYWNADPNTEYIAYSIAKNKNDEWGPLAKVKFTTPAEPENAAKKAKTVNGMPVRKATPNAKAKGAFQMSQGKALQVSAKKKQSLVEQ